MNRLDFLEQLYTLRFEAGKNLYYYEAMIAKWQFVDYWLTIAVLVLTIVGVFATLITSLTPQSGIGKFFAKWWVAIPIAALPALAALCLAISSTRDSVRDHMGAFVRWKDLASDVNYLSTGIQSVSLGEKTVPDYLVKQLIRAQDKYADIEKSEPIETDDPALLIAWRKEAKAIYGIEAKKPDDVKKLREADFIEWAKRRYGMQLDAETLEKLKTSYKVTQNPAGQSASPAAHPASSVARAQ